MTVGSANPSFRRRSSLCARDKILHHFKFDENLLRCSAIAAARASEFGRSIFFNFLFVSGFAQAHARWVAMIGRFGGPLSLRSDSALNGLTAKE